MQRRLFLNLAAAAAAAGFQKSPLGIGFLGASHSHAEGKLAAVQSVSDWHLIGVAESDAKIRQKLEGRGIPLLSREQLLEHPESRAIAVESPVRDHARDGLAVLEAGKHLHLEKAPADTMAGFRQVVELARNKNLLLQVGYMWRHNPGIVGALEAARRGWLGNVYAIRGNIGNQLEERRRPEWAEFRGGVMFELGCHLIDPMVRLLGRPRVVTPFLQKAGEFRDTLNDNTIAVLEWEKAEGIVQGSNLEPHSSRYRILEIRGTNGRAIVNPIEQPVLTIDLENPAGPYAAGSQKRPLPNYRRYVDDFVELAAAVRGEKKLAVTPEEDLLVEEAVLRCSGMFS